MLEALEGRQYLSAIPLGPAVIEPLSQVIDFNSQTLQSYGGAAQDVSGPVQIGSGGNSLQIIGNRWKLIEYPYEVTENTVLEFDFTSTKQGEVHGIGFDNDTVLSQDTFFQLYGTQTNWGINAYQNYSATAGQTVHYTINVGQFFTGQMQYLTFGMDHDVSSPNGESIFSSVRIYEQDQIDDQTPAPASDAVEPLNLAANPIVSYNGPSQDVISALTLYDDDKAMHLAGNSWKKTAFNYTITANTVIEFDFKSSAQGEVHGIGFDNDDILSRETFFQVYGTQADWGLPQVASYTGNGDWQHYSINVGDFFTGDMTHLTFGMDYDVSVPLAESHFANILIYESTADGGGGDPTGDSGGPIDFSAVALQSYGGTAQDVKPTVIVSNAGQTIEVSGNSWKKIDFPYEVTQYTVLEFDFLSTRQGEIHGIGFDNDDILSQNTFFQLYGTQPGWGNAAYQNYAGSAGQTVHYTINVGQFFTGQMQYLTLGMDHDVNNPTGQSIFSNVRVYEDLDLPVEEPPPADPDALNFNDFTLQSYNGKAQDVAGPVTIEDNGQTLHIVGNRWKKISLPYNVTANTVIEFDFKSTSLGEVHGIGFDNDDILSRETFFQVFGTQAGWGLPPVDPYTGNGDWQHYTINVGEHFTGAMQFLTFGMDHDVANPTGESYFSNVKVYEKNVAPPVGNQPPVLAVIANQTVAAGQSLNINLTATDPEGQGLTFATFGLPAFATLTDHGNGTATISVNPPAGTPVGTHEITVNVVDSGSPAKFATRTFTLGVTAAPANQAPVLAVIANQNVTAGQVLVVNLSATDPNGNALTFAATNLPAYASLVNNNNGTATITFSPPANQAADTRQISVTVTDNGSPALSNSKSFTLNVAAAPVVNQAPVLAAIANQNVTAGQVLVVNLSATDPNGNALAFAATNLPAYASLVNNNNGTATITFSPPANQAADTRQISVTVTDNGSPALSNSKSFTLNVAAAPVVNQQPILAAIADQNVTAGQTLNINLSATDPDGNALVFTTFGLPSFATLTDNGNGTASIAFNPPASQAAGVFDITVNVVDNGSPSKFATRTFKLNVAAAPVETPVNPPAPPADYAYINFNNVTVLSYGSNDVSKIMAVEDDGRTLHLSENTWKKLNLTYNITPNTVLVFDFRSTDGGEVQGIGFDTDDNLSPETFFAVNGTQIWGIRNYATYSGDGWVRYEIPVGQFFTGAFSRLVFANDHDVASPTAQSYYANVAIFENLPNNAGSPPPAAPDGLTTIDFNNVTVKTFDPQQEMGGVSSIEHGGASLYLRGNTWKMIDMPYTVTTNTFIEFDFKSSAAGEVQGIGFDTDTTISSDRTFKVFGTQAWGIQNYATYSTADGWVHYKIPVGQFYTGQMNHLFFANDHDVANATGESLYANVAVYEGAATPVTPTYNAVYGWGMVDANAAVAMALGLSSLPAQPDWGNSNNWNLNAMNVPDAWAAGYTGQGVIVAVIDTGVNINHPDLVNNIYVKPGEIPGDGIDNDGNGFIDDAVGWDFVENDKSPQDTSGHGTLVAGVIAAANNGSGATGVAPGAKIMPIRVIDGLGAGTFESVLAGIDYAVRNGAKVINLSISFNGPHPDLAAKIQWAQSQGVVVVMAAGNDGAAQPVYPARYAEFWGLAVGAIDSNGKLAAFTNRSGTNVMDYIVAPGVSVYTTNRNGTYSSVSATSFAAPQVAGLAALILSANPSLTPAQVEQIIIMTARSGGVIV